MRDVFLEHPLSCSIDSPRLLRPAMPAPMKAAMKAARRDPYKKLSDEEIRLARLWYKEDGVEPAEIAELLRRAEVAIRSVRRGFLAQLRHSYAMRKPGEYGDVCRKLITCRRLRAFCVGRVLGLHGGAGRCQPRTGNRVQSRVRTEGRAHTVTSQLRHSYITVTSQLRHSYVMRKLG